MELLYTLSLPGQSLQTSLRRHITAASFLRRRLLTQQLRPLGFFTGWFDHGYLDTALVLVLAPYKL